MEKIVIYNFETKFMERKEKYVRKENNINVNYKLYILNIIFFGYINLYAT